MSSLARMQRDFMEALFSDAGAQPRGIEIYRRNVLANLHDCLAATYPVVRRLVGAAFFREAARRYSRERPSRSGDLHEYGEAFAEFLESYSPARGLAYLGDVARLEWACHECCHAAEAGTLDYEALARVVPARLGEIRFQLHPAVRLVRSEHPIAVIWEANQPGRDASVAGAEGPNHVACARKDGEVRVTSLAPRDWEFLRALALGATLEEASAAFGERDAASLADALSCQLQAGVIAGFALDRLDA